MLLMLSTEAKAQAPAASAEVEALRAQVEMLTRQVERLASTVEAQGQVIAAQQGVAQTAAPKTLPSAMRQDIAAAAKKTEAIGPIAMGTAPKIQSADGNFS